MKNEGCMLLTSVGGVSVGLVPVQTEQKQSGGRRFVFTGSGDRLDL